MKKTPFKVRKTKSNKKKPKQKMPESPKKIEEEPLKPDTIYNFYNNINISSNIEMDESTLADIEYAKTLQMALKDAIKQNENMAEELNKCREENERLEKEIEEKDNVIYELSQYYQYCQNNHLGYDNVLEPKEEKGYQSCKKNRKGSGNKKRKIDVKNIGENGNKDNK